MYKVIRTDSYINPTYREEIGCGLTLTGCYDILRSYRQNVVTLDYFDFKYASKEHNLRGQEWLNHAR